MLTCPKCAKVFKRQSGLTRHLARTPPCDQLPPIACAKCGQTFATETQLTRHRHRLKPCDNTTPAPLPETFKCNDCGKFFARKDTLKRHREGYCGNPLPPSQKDPEGLETAKAIALGRNGVCLSTEYIGRHADMRWRCNTDGNEWLATLANVKNHGEWCPACAQQKRKSEKETRALFEYFTDKMFPETAGLFPSNPLWRLDGYCEELGIAFEYHGRQHYEYVGYFHRNGIEDFEKQQARDLEVESTAPLLDEPIALIVVPYWLTKKERIDFIWGQLLELSVVDDN